MKILCNMAIIALCGFILTGCSNDPFKDTDIPTRDKAIVLVKASIYGEKKIHPKKMTSGFGYGKCMRKEWDKKTCQRLYKYMVDYIKQQEDFKKATVADITDHKNWLHLKEAYFMHRFNEMPV